MRHITRVLVVLVLASSAGCAGCKGKKARGAGAASKDLKAFGTPADLGIGEDVYVGQSLDREGKFLLYALRRDPKEGWGFNHGYVMYSYNVELNIKLPLGKLGRSNQFGFVYLGKKEMLAVLRTVDTNDDGDVDERDGNALYIMAPDGLDEEPVSAVREHVSGFWSDPKGEFVIFATSEHWEGKVVPLPREGEKPVEPDWSGDAYTWNYETKETNKIGRCLKFYGISPDGEQYACLEPKGAGDKIEVTVMSRDLLQKSKVTLPTTQDARVVPLGGGRLAYTKVESSSTGDRTTLWIRGADGKDQRVTSPTVETTIIRPLADGGILFMSRAEYTVSDGTVIRAISGDGTKVYDLLRVEGTDLLELPTTTGNGKLLLYAVFPEESFEANPKGIVYAGRADKKAKVQDAKKVAEEHIPGLGETLVAALQKSLDDGGPVKEDAITVNVPMMRAVLPMSVKEEANDEALMKAALSVKDAIAPVLAKEGYSAVLPLDGLEDAAAVLKWHEEFGRHMSYLVAYNLWMPVREEYDIVVEDLVFLKLPGCADPRMVQLHCNGWVAAIKDVGDLEFMCRATPLDPNMKIREGKEPVAGVVPGAEAVLFDVIADKVDPRRSHRSHFDLLMFSGDKQVPYFDSSWAEATQAWIAVLRGIPGGEVLPTTKLYPFAWGEETFLPLAKWYPSTVVRQEQHLDLHIFIDEEGTPPIVEKETWDALAMAAVESFGPFQVEYDPGHSMGVRISLYKGQLLMSEMWHKTPEELAIEGCDMGEPDACYQLGLIMKEKDKKLAADYAFYDACELGSEEACLELSGGVPVEEGKGGAKPEAVEEEEPLKKKKASLPPEMEEAPPKLPSLKKSEIQEAIRAHRNEIDYCFQKSGGSGQMLISVKVNISGKGKVEGVGVKHSKNVGQDVQTCVLQAVRRITFPEPPDGQPIKLSYPFTYVPQ